MPGKWPSTFSFPAPFFRVLAARAFAAADPFRFTEKSWINNQRDLQRTLDHEAHTYALIFARGKPRKFNG